jgi:hypothetical protein
MQSTIQPAPVNPVELPARRVAVRPVDVLTARLVEQGWRPGYPATLTAASRYIDSHLAMRSKCGSCGKRGRQPTPYHHPHGGYKLLAVCRCGAVEEL